MYLVFMAAFSDLMVWIRMKRKVFLILAVCCISKGQILFEGFDLDGDISGYLLGYQLTFNPREPLSGAFTRALPPFDHV
jgi:hypothetical protein